MGASINGVSVIVPAHNNQSTIGDCLEAVTGFRRSVPLEIIVVDDGSSDATVEIAAAFPSVSVISVPHGGAARAMNTGIKAARYDIVVIMEADAIPEKDWLLKILPCLDSPGVAAVGGHAITANNTIIGKLAGFDVEHRLDRAPEDIDQLATLNTAYRRQVLLDIGLLDEELKAAYDVDLSRRLKNAGYHLLLNKDASCLHYWKDNFCGYIRQQYHYAYYRMGLVRKYQKPHDDVSGLGMILQVPATLIIIAVAALGSLLSPLALYLLLLLPLMHLPVTVRLFVRRRKWYLGWLPFLFTLRNLDWLSAVLSWLVVNFIQWLSSIRRLIFPDHRAK